MIGDIDSAKKTLYNYHQVWKQYGFTPEFYDIPNSKSNSKRDGYPLRPEFAESVLYLYRATKDPHLLQIGADVIESIESAARTECGFATVKSVDDHSIEDRMESFFLAETLKYLYLLFDETNFVHNDGSKGRVIDRNGSECVVDSGGYVFNTEAHLIDIAAVYCCSDQKKTESKILSDFQNSLDLFSLLDSDTKISTSLHKIKQNYYKKVLEESYFSETESSFENQTDSSGIPFDSNKKSEIIIQTKTELKPESETNEEFNEFTIDSNMDSTKEKNTVFSDTSTTKLRTEETMALNNDNLLPTLDSSLSFNDIPNVEKTVSQDFSLEKNSKSNSEDFIKTNLISSEPLKTSEITKNSLITPEVIEPTHSIEGWHSKSVSEEVTENISIMKDNTLISDKLYENVLKILNNNSVNQNFGDISWDNITFDDFNQMSSNNYELLLCPSQPFLSRLSNFGQMIIYS